MSVIFEGILVNSTNFSKLVELTKLKEINLSQIAFDTEHSLIYKENAREFSKDIFEIAVYLSTKLETVLLIRYDSRISYRSSTLYREGKKIKEFSEEDELFVPLDEDGEPLTDNQRLKQSDFLPDEEYETVMNAIQLGLESINIDPGKWEKLVDLINTL